MDKVLFHGEPLPQGLLHKALSDLDIKVCPSRKDLAAGIIREEDIIGVIVNQQVLSEDYLDFFYSLAGHFPLIKFGIISDSLLMTDETHWKQFPGYTDEEKLIEEIHVFIFSDAVRNRRRHNRFDWILKGELTIGEETGKYEIHSISAGGAFFKLVSGVVTPGISGDLTIAFRNFRLKCRCTILESRSASSNLPYGFPVRFEGLTDESRDILDKIVNDALVQILLTPEEEPDIPSLDEDTLTPDFEMVV